jgi:hypothetical protein
VHSFGIDLRIVLHGCLGPRNAHSLIFTPGPTRRYAIPMRLLRAVPCSQMEGLGGPKSIAGGAAEFPGKNAAVLAAANTTQAAPAKHHDHSPTTQPHQTTL